LFKLCAYAAAQCAINGDQDRAQRAMAKQPRNSAVCRAYFREPGL